MNKPESHVTKSQVSGLKIGENIISLVMTIRIVHEQKSRKKYPILLYVIFSLLIFFYLHSTDMKWSCYDWNQILCYCIFFSNVHLFERYSKKKKKILCQKIYFQFFFFLFVLHKREKSDLNLNQICICFTFSHSEKHTKHNGNIILNFST